MSAFEADRFNHSRTSPRRTNLFRCFTIVAGSFGPSATARTARFLRLAQARCNASLPAISERTFAALRRCGPPAPRREPRSLIQLRVIQHLMTECTAPAFGSSEPYTSRRMRACTKAPAHIAHGSIVANSSHSPRRWLPTVAPACAARRFPRGRWDPCPLMFRFHPRPTIWPLQDHDRADRHFSQLRAHAGRSAGPPPSRVRRRRRRSVMAQGSRLTLWLLSLCHGWGCPAYSTELPIGRATVLPNQFGKRPRSSDYAEHRAHDFGHDGMDDGRQPRCERRG